MEARKPAEAQASRGGAHPRAVLARLRERLLEGYRRALAPYRDRPCVLVQFPDHENPGDAAIWEGERRLLRRVLRRRPVVATINRRLRESVARVGRQAVVLLHGGGNFGDLWPEPHRLRLELLEAHPDLDYVQLPQSIHFVGGGTLDRTRAALRRTRSFTLLVRESASLAAATDQLGWAHSLLLPDSAFALAVPERMPQAPGPTAVWRSDREASPDRNAPPDTGGEAAWMSAPSSWRHTLLRGLRRVGLRDHLPVRWSEALCGPLHEGLARRRVARAWALLGARERIETDRLHAHVLACMLGRPNRLLPNVYAKNESTFETWTHAFECASFGAASALGDGP